MKRLVLGLLLAVAACGGALDQPAFVEAVAKEASVEGTGAWAKEQLAAGKHVANTSWDAGCWIYQDAGGVNRYGDGWIGIPHGTRFRLAISDTSTGWVLFA